ncbi:MAG TPA: quinone oxidoreductase [Candidatus Binataceae bacterium]|nr:quinone oxidoreductase [Candidatus Binataceae bacterium]
MKTNAIVVSRTGGPEVLEFKETTLADPKPGEVLIRQHAIGLNYIDIYLRTGVYPAPLPFTPGGEGAGIIEAVGAGINEFKVGDRVGYCAGPLGSYSEARLMPAASLIKLPNGITEEVAAAALLKGLTAQYLIFSTYQVKPSDTILVHAAAGGVGLILCQWAKHLGATVIGTVGSEAKAKLAAAHGCAHVIDYSREDFVARVKEITRGAGLPVVYDSVGQATFMKSLDCLQPRGLMVSYGQASGMVPPFSVNTLTPKGSLYLTRPSLQHYVLTREALLERTASLFGAITSGVVKCEAARRFKLRDAAEAHRALASRETTGSSVLIP